MSDPSDTPSPPTDLPGDVAATLREMDIHDLRETIIYAQELLHNHNAPLLQIEPFPGEEIVKITEHPGYTEVVKRQPCGNDCENCPHGPYAYHVTRERHPDGKEKLHWVLLGRDKSVDE